MMFTIRPDTYIHGLWAWEGTDSDSPFNHFGLVLRHGDHPWHARWRFMRPDKGECQLYEMWPQEGVEDKDAVEGLWELVSQSSREAIEKLGMTEEQAKLRLVLVEGGAIELIQAIAAIGDASIEIDKGVVWGEMPEA